MTTVTASRLLVIEIPSLVVGFPSTGFQEPVAAKQVTMMCRCAGARHQFGGPVWLRRQRLEPQTRWSRVGWCRIMPVYLVFARIVHCGLSDPVAKYRAVSAFSGGHSKASSGRRRVSVSVGGRRGRVRVGLWR
jgi:hypothetical protein